MSNNSSNHRKTETANSKLKTSNNCPSPSPSNDGQPKLVKKIPPIKAPVGLAKGPDLKNCKSKVGSFQNIKHQQAGGAVVIPTKKLEWKTTSKIGSLENKDHKPGGGKQVIETRKLEWKTSAKVQSLANINHKPGGGNVKIFNESYSKTKSPIDRSQSGTPSEKDGQSGDKSYDNLVEHISNLSMR